MNLKVDSNLEYKNLEKFYLECIFISKKWWWDLKKNDRDLKFNLEKVHLEKVVRNLI